MMRQMCVCLLKMLCEGEDIEQRERIRVGKRPIGRMEDQFERVSLSHTKAAGDREWNARHTACGGFKWNCPFVPGWPVRNGLAGLRI